MEKLIVTDLDGTLLDHETYEFAQSVEGLREAERLGVAVVFCTSKTQAECAWWRNRMGVPVAENIVESGGAIVFGDGRVEALGAPYAELRRALLEASRVSRCVVEGFGDWSAEQVAVACGLDLEMAEMARWREWDEPFVVKTEGREGELVREIERRRLGWSRGGRFWHIHGRNDKAEGVRRVIARRGGKRKVRVLGLGDGLNDASFLREVEEAVLMPSGVLEELRRQVPGARVAESWGAAVLEFLGR